MKLLAICVIVVVVGYFIVLPALLWPLVEPSATVSMAQEWRHDGDMPIRVRVSSVHANFVVTQVRVTFDYDPTAKKPAPIPRILYSDQKEGPWSTWNVNRLTWPRKKELEVMLPLAELALAGEIQPGTHKGQVQVEVEYVRGLGRRRGSSRGIRSFTRTISVPYEVRLE